MTDYERDNQLQSEDIETEEGRNRDAEKQRALLCSADNSPSCIRYFSMFTGVGGFELGLQNARLIQQESETRMSDTDRTSSQFYSCVGFSEIDKYANQLLANKFPGVKNYGDATKINPSELPDFDMLCGGFPCQSFSIAGKRRGFGDTRGTMFFEIARILEVKRPRLVFLENVKGLLNHDKGKTFSVILQTLEELGYEIQWMVLNSKFFGVPQNRERVFIIGSLGGASRPEILPFRTSCEEYSPQLESSKQPSKDCIRTLTARGENSYPHRESRLIANKNKEINPDGM